MTIPKAPPALPMVALPVNLLTMRRRKVRSRKKKRVTSAMLTLKVAKLKRRADEVRWCPKNRSRHLQEDESDDEPRSQEDSNCAFECFRVFGVSSGNTEVGVEEGSKGQPETAVRGKS